MSERPSLGELRDACRSYLDGRSPSWSDLASMGWTGTLVPEEHGGMGWSWREAVVVAAELGRSLSRTPFVASALVAVDVLLHAPASDTRDELLGGIATGERIVGVSVAGGLVLDAPAADTLLLTTPDGRVVLADCDEPAVQITPMPLYDETRQLAEVELDGAHVIEIANDVETLRRATALAVAADAAGGAEAALERAVAYAKQRVQFDRPIGSFQAVKHRLADLYLLVQGSDAIVEAAADDPSLAGVAYSYATDAYAKVAGDAILVHGAIGFTWDHDLHRFLKRAKLDQHLVGSGASHRDRYLAEKLKESAA